MSGFALLLENNSEPIPARTLQRFGEWLGPYAHDGLVAHHGGGWGLIVAREKLDDRAGVTDPVSVDGFTWVAGNVRIDGQPELIAAIHGAIGERPPANVQDLELIAWAWRAWGEDCVRYLVGDYAFVIWNTRTRYVYGARDYLGWRKLHYGWTRRDGLIIADHLDCLRCHPDFEANLSRNGIISFLCFGSTSAFKRGETAYQRARLVPPGHFLRHLPGSEPKVLRYYTPWVNTHRTIQCSKDEVVGQFRHLFRQAIVDRLRSPSAVILLSGGMDSTAVAAMTALAVHDGDLPVSLQALTQNHRRVNGTLEASLARWLCRNLGVKWHALLMDDVPFLTPKWHPEQLVMPSLGFGHWRTVRAAAAVSPLGLTGASGDMMRCSSLRLAWRHLGPARALAGIAQMWAAYGFLPRPDLGFARNLRWFMGDPDPHWRYSFPSWLCGDMSELEELHRQYHRFEDSSCGTMPIDSWLEADGIGVFESSPQDGRFMVTDPLGDRRLFEFYRSLRMEPWLDHKFLLREAMEGILPPEIRLRPRTQLPVAPCYVFARDPSAKWIDDLEKVEVLETLIDFDKVPKLLQVQGNLEAAVPLLNLAFMKLWFQGQGNHRVGPILGPIN